VSDGTPTAGTGGLRGALARLGGTLFEFARTRLELATVELAEERERTFERLLLLVAAAVGFAFALLAASAFVVVWFWDTHRLLALAGVTVFYVVVGSIALVRLRALQRTAPKPFASTLAELERDRQWLAERLGK
jgi:uncharacterized membrane protein YqjE